MTESMSKYPLLWLLVAVLLILAVIVIVMVSRSKKNGGDSPELLLSARDVAQLREAFSTLSQDKLDTVHGRELIFAVVTNIESKLDNGIEFDALTQHQQYVYALWYFSQSIGNKGMCNFFREYEPPLTQLIVPAMIAIAEAKMATIVGDAVDAFDDKNESASCDKQSLQSIDEAFNQEYDQLAYYNETEALIRANLGDFLDTAV